MKLLIINATYHTPQNMVSDATMNVTLNTINRGIQYTLDDI